MNKFSSPFAGLSTGNVFSSNNEFSPDLAELYGKALLTGDMSFLSPKQRKVLTDYIKQANNAEAVMDISSSDFMKNLDSTSQKLDQFLGGYGE